MECRRGEKRSFAWVVAPVVGALLAALLLSRVWEARQESPSYGGHSTSYWARQAASWQGRGLYELHGGGEQAIPVAIALLDDGRAQVRWLAVQAVREIVRSDARLVTVPAVEEAVLRVARLAVDENDRVRLNVINALGAMGQTSMSPELRTRIQCTLAEMLNDPHSGNAVLAAHRLGMTQPLSPSASHQLLTVAGAGKANLRREALRALGVDGRPSAKFRGLLLASLEDEHLDVRAVAAKCLTDMAGRGLFSLSEAEASELERCVASLGSAGLSAANVPDWILVMW